jgi:hypothetical protein
MYEPNASIEPELKDLSCIVARLEATIKANLYPIETNAIAVVIPMMRICWIFPVVTQTAQTCRLSEAMMSIVTIKLIVLLVTETARSELVTRLGSPETSVYGCNRLPVTKQHEKMQRRAFPTRHRALRMKIEDFLFSDLVNKRSTRRRMIEAPI